MARQAGHLGRDEQGKELRDRGLASRLKPLVPSKGLIEI